MRSRAAAPTVALAVALATAWFLDRSTAAQQMAPRSFTVEQILSLPSPDNLTASPVGGTIAWTFDERGARNIYAADAPRFEPRRLTSYLADDGQELTYLSFSSDGRTIIYVRGGDHGGSRPADPPNPSASPIPPKMQVWSVSAEGGSPRLLGEGDEPVIAPDGRRVAFVRDRRIWLAPIDGSKPAEPAFLARGTSGSPAWSPDGGTLAFVLNRGDHSFIALFTPGEPIRYLAPSTSRDSSPVWSPDGRKIAFVRQPGVGGTPRSPLVEVPSPWAILVADLSAGTGESRHDPAAVPVVTSGDSPADAIRGIRAGSAYAGPPTIAWCSCHIGTGGRTCIRFHTRARAAGRCCSRQGRSRWSRSR